MQKINAMQLYVSRLSHRDSRIPVVPHKPGRFGANTNNPHQLAYDSSKISCRLRWPDRSSQNRFCAVASWQNLKCSMSGVWFSKQFIVAYHHYCSDCCFYTILWISRLPQCGTSKIFILHSKQKIQILNKE